MMFWTLIFLVISVVAAAFGFANIAADSTRVAKILFAVSIVMFAVSFAFQLLE